MAAAIERATGVEVELVSGDRGEFTVRVGDEVVARKTLMGFPDEDKVVEAVRDALSRA